MPSGQEFLDILFVVLFLKHYSTENNLGFPAAQLPRVKEFADLYLTSNLVAARKELKGLSGVYAIVCNSNEKVYIGGSSNFSNRLYDHISDRGSNQHLQNAIVKYSLENFVFIVVELYKFS